MFIPWAAFQFCWKVGKSYFKLGQTSKENSESGQEFYQLPLSKHNLLVLEIYSFRLIVKTSQWNFGDHWFLLIFINVLLLFCFRQTWPHNIQHTSEELPTSSFKWKAAAFVSRLLILTQFYWCGSSQKGGAVNSVLTRGFAEQSGPADVGEQVVDVGGGLHVLRVHWCLQGRGRFTLKTWSIASINC